jgi:heat shock protein HslJ
VVEDLNRTGIIDNSRLTLRFADNGQLSGRASCNTYLGQYKLTGEALILSPTATTLMSCPPALMQQERRFLTLLQAVNRFELRADGALILHTADGRTLTARR